MATPPSDDTKTMFKLLADGQWHSYDEIRDRIAVTVPPGRALRKYQERIDYARRYKREPDYDTDATEDERIFFGARACAQIVITSWKGRGVEYQGEGSMKRIRQALGFKTWGIEQLPPDPPGPEQAPAQEPTEAPEVPTSTPERSEPSEPDAAPPEWPPVPEPAPQQDEEPIDVGFMSLPTLVGPEGDSVYDLADRPDGSPIADWVLSSQPVTYDAWPTCEDCGSLVVSADAHDDFHARYETPVERPEMALFAESEISNLFSGVLSKQLDDFQTGMQDWFAQQFAQLEDQIQRLKKTTWTIRPGPENELHR